MKTLFAVVLVLITNSVFAGDGSSNFDTLMVWFSALYTVSGYWLLANEHSPLYGWAQENVTIALIAFLFIIPGIVSYSVLN